MAADRMTDAARLRAYLDKVPGAAKGNRDDATFGTACAVVERFDLPREDLLAALLDWNTAHNAPPLSLPVVRAKLDSACRATAYDPAKAAAPTNGRATAGRPAPAPRQPDPPEPPALPLPDVHELARARRLLLQAGGGAGDKARRFLRELGVDPTACGWGLGHLTEQEAHTAKLPAAAAAGWRFLIPVADPVTGALCDVRRYAARCFGEAPDGFKVLPWSKGHGQAKPYRWEALAAAAAVVWCEGEKDCEALRARGFVAVSHTCGASSARKVAEELPADLVTGRRYVVLFDADTAGHTAAEKLAAALVTRGAEAAVAAWPDPLPDGQALPEGFDASDWCAAGYSPEDLQALLAAAVPWHPKAKGTMATADAAPHHPAPPGRQQAAGAAAGPDRDKEASMAEPSSLRDSDEALPDADTPRACVGKLQALLQDTGAEYFRTDAGEEFAVVTEAGRRAALPVTERGGGLRHWLTRAYRDRYHGRIPNETALRGVLSSVEAEANRPGTPVRQTPLRVAAYGGGVCLDLGDPDYRVVMVTADGWEVQPCPADCYFRRTQATGALPLPDPDGTLEDLAEAL
ncbi:MAG: hypothetical protein IT317_24830, partial [Anaerolineales bacterium]|nr:hypothetical protein [Anaerolineales bacterium]